MPHTLPRRARAASWSVLVLALVACLGTARAQAFAGKGPHLIGTAELELDNPLAGTAKLRLQIRYPALSAGASAVPDLAQGPYPLLVFGHGLGNSPTPYAALLDHLGSWGFVVAAPDTATAGPQALLAQDMLGSAAALKLLAQAPGSIIHALIAPGAVAFAGHSLGGGAAVVAGAMHPGAPVLAIAPWNMTDTAPGVPSPEQAAGMLRSPLCVVVGSFDVLTPVDTNAALIYAAATSVMRLRALSVVAGAGHNDPLLFGQVSNQGTAFLRAYLTDAAPALDEVYGPSALANTAVSMTFEVVSPDCFATGTAAPGELLGVHVSGPPGSSLWAVAAASSTAATPGTCLQLPAQGLVVLAKGTAGASQLVSFGVMLPADLFGLSDFTWYLQGVRYQTGASPECSAVRTLVLQTGS